MLRRQRALTLVIALALAPWAVARGQQTTGQSGAPPPGAMLPPGQGATITGDVVAAVDGRPLPYATIIIDPGNRQRFADAAGSFVVGQLAPGSYHLRVRQIGFAARDTTIVIAGAGPTKRLRIVMRIVALRLPPVLVQGERSSKCLTPGIPDSTVDPALAALFAELQKNVERYRLLIQEYPFQFAREEWRVNRNDAGYEETVALDTVWYDVQQMEDRPYKPGTVVIWQTTDNGTRRQYMPLPTFGYLGDSLFTHTHCFEYMGEDTTGGASPTIRVDFQPATSIHTPDLEGSVYLDEDRYIVRRAVFRLTEPDRVVPPISELSVTTTFREVLPLVPLFDEVRYRKPTYKTGTAAELEVDRLLTLKFQHGGPGDRSGR
jgi:hypothetical protein